LIYCLKENDVDKTRLSEFIKDEYVPNVKTRLYAAHDKLIGPYKDRLVKELEDVATTKDTGVAHYSCIVGVPKALVSVTRNHSGARDRNKLRLIEFSCPEAVTQVVMSTLTKEIAASIPEPVMERYFELRKAFELASRLYDLVDSATNADGAYIHARNLWLFRPELEQFLPMPKFDVTSRTKNVPDVEMSQDLKRVVIKEMMKS
jgi:hypothetical protein